MTAVRALARLAAGFLLAFSLVGAPVTSAVEAGSEAIDLRATPIAFFRIGRTETRFGALEFRGGLQVSSSESLFGSLSGLDFMPDGRLLAVSDTGYWFTARLTEEDGRLTGIADGHLAPILDSRGRQLAGKQRSDAEGLRIVPRGDGFDALVSFEQRNDLMRFSGPDLAAARSQRVRLPATLTGLPRNRGLESVAVAPKNGPLGGATVLIAERSPDRAGNHRGWIVGGPRAGMFSLVRSGDFDISDAAFLPGGDLLVLERRFTLIGGFAMRIRRIAAADLVPGATVDGRVLVEADLRFQIDNMEGMAVRPGENGETLITLCSDDNGLVVQRTILLQFALPPDATPLPRRHPLANR